MNIDDIDPFGIYDEAARGRAIRYFDEHHAGYRRGAHSWHSGQTVEVNGQQVAYNNRNFVEDELQGTVVYRHVQAGQPIRVIKTVRDAALWARRNEECKYWHEGSQTWKVRWDTWCNLAASHFSREYGAPDLQYHTCGHSPSCPHTGSHAAEGTFCTVMLQRNANTLHDRLHQGNYDDDKAQFVQVDWRTGEAYARRGGLVVAVWKNPIPRNAGHIGTLVGGFVGDEQGPLHVRTFQAGWLWGYMSVSRGFGGLETWAGDPDRVGRRGAELFFFAWISRTPRYAFHLPFAPYGEQSSPAQAYHNNERGVGGFFPLGLHANLHGGIHLHPPGEGLQEVRCLAPGFVVAARLASNRESERFLGAPRGFVLVRHELRERSADGALSEERQAIYSLYMHLLPPTEEAKPEWLEALERHEHGSLVVVDPRVATPGALRWAAAAVAAPQGRVQVWDGDAPRPLELGAPSASRVVAVHRQQPLDTQEALSALEAGAVVTFSAPFLMVGGGDVLGHVQGGTDPDSGLPTGFLHWELFAPEDAGLAELLELAAQELSLSFPRIEDKGEGGGPSDNSFSKEELNQLLKDNLPADDQGRLSEDLLTSDSYDAEILGLMHQPAPLSFSSAGFVGPAEPAGEHGDRFADHGGCGAGLRYPVTVLVESYEDLLQQAPAVRVSFRPDGVGDPIETTATAAEGGYAVSLQVPARATHLVIEPQAGAGFLLDAEVGLPQAALREQLLAQDREQLAALVPFRWRHLRVNHATDWMEAAMRRFLEARGHDEQQIEEATARFRPAAWWGRGPRSEEDPEGEERVLGSEEEERSIFGEGGYLPANGEIDNVHPVTGMWLLNTLAKRGRLEPVTAWDPFASGSDAGESPAACGWVTTGAEVDQAALGDEVYGLVVAGGYVTGGADPSRGWATLVARGEGRSLTLARRPYQQGVVSACLPMPCWGSWTLGVEGQAVPPDAPAIPRTLTVAKPEPLDVTGRPGDGGNGELSWTIPFKSNAPTRLEGWVLVQVQTAKQGEAAAGPLRGTTLSIPADAVAARPTVPEWAGVDFDDTGHWVVGAAGDNTKIPPDGNFYYSEYKNDFPAGQDFKLQRRLALAVQEVRLAYAGKSPEPAAYPYLNALQLQGDGSTVHLECYRGPVRGLGQVDWRTEANHTKLHEAATETAGIKAVVKHDQTVELSVEELSGEGSVTLAFEPAEALARLLETETFADDEELRVTFGFLVPNGGRRVVWPDGLPPGDAPQVDWDAESQGLAFLGRECHSLDVAQVKGACGDDCFELWADGPSLTLTRPSFGDVSVRYASYRTDGDNRTFQVSVALSAELRGDLAQWAVAQPRFRLGDHLFGEQVRNEGELRATIALEGRFAPGQELAIEAIAPGSSGIAAKPFTLDTSPRLEDLQAEWGDAEVVFTCLAHHFPTVVNLRCTVEKQTEAGAWEAVGAQPHAVFDHQADQARYAGDGFCDAEGKVRVRVSRTKVPIAAGGAYRVRIFRPSNWYGVGGIPSAELLAERVGTIPGGDA